MGQQQWAPEADIGQTRTAADGDLSDPAEHAAGAGRHRRLVTVYEIALKSFGLADRADPITEMVANKIIEIASHG
jgi:hypothetical protein